MLRKGIVGIQTGDSDARWTPPDGYASRRALAILAAFLAAFLVGATVGVASIDIAPVLYLIYVGVVLALGGLAATTLAWMLYAWQSPEAFTDTYLAGDELEPQHSFSLIVPARHEEAVLEATLSRLIQSEHPRFEVIVVVGADDPETRAAAERVATSARTRVRVKVVVDASWPKSKPKALNAALPYCSGSITGVFDAEDDVHPTLLQRVDESFQRTDADVVQAGVQLMNFRSSWLTVRNVLEYYFWFRSRLHLHARQQFIPLGGNTVFIRTRVIQSVSGWDPDCLAEDCELGVRLSAMGARTVVFYDPQLATREECPPTLRAFVRQRTRWSQGYLQTLSRGYWRQLPSRQRALGAYILASPYAMAAAWLLIPVAAVTAIAVKAPLLITLVSFVPVLPMVSILLVEIVGLDEFCRAYGQRASPRDYARLVFGTLLYQAVLAYSAARAVARELRGSRGWEKTEHLGLHLAGAEGYAPERSLDSPGHLATWKSRLQRTARSARQLEPRRAMLAWKDGRGGSDQVTPSGHASNEEWRFDPSEPMLGARNAEPLWIRLAGSSPAAAATLPAPGIPSPGVVAAAWLTGARGRWRELLSARMEATLKVALLVFVGLLVAVNLLHWPTPQFDEGTYIANAWALTHGKLAPYTYSYGHPPLGWLLIFLWTWTGRLFGHGAFSIDTGRELMLVVSLVSCWLLYTLARRLEFGVAAAAAAVVLFACSPLALFFHRAVLLDNPSIAWGLAAFVLARSPGRRLWAFAASGACFAVCVLSKETALAIFPALLIAAAGNTDRRTARYCLALFMSFFVVLLLSYPLYAALKGELVPGPGHVSLIGYAILQLAGRAGTGSLFNAHSQTHAIVAGWLSLDPWLVGAALVLLPIALARRSTRAVAVAYLIQLALVLRPGYLPNMYVIGFLPFAALIVAGSGEALLRRWRLTAPRRLTMFVAPFALALVAVVAVSWAKGDGSALSAKPDTPTRAAEQWLVEHVGHHQRLIVTDDLWIYLIAHDFDSHAMRGGFYSRTVVSYWPLDYDPAVKRAFPLGWRDFDYVVSNQDMRGTLTNTPTAAQAVAHSRVVARFGRGAQRIEIRAITPGFQPSS